MQEEEEECDCCVCRGGENIGFDAGTIKENEIPEPKLPTFSRNKDGVDVMNWPEKEVI